MKWYHHCETWALVKKSIELIRAMRDDIVTHSCNGPLKHDGEIGPVRSRAEHKKNVIILVRIINVKLAKSGLLRGLFLNLKELLIIIINEKNGKFESGLLRGYS